MTIPNPAGNYAQTILDQLAAADFLRATFGGPKRLASSRRSST
jgi:hypothetical protein